MASEIVVQQEVNPLAILQAAVDKGASVEQLSLLMGLAERWELNRDKRALREGLAAFKLNPPEIVKDRIATIKNKETGATHTYKYADLEAVTGACEKALAKVGITHGYVIAETGNLISVSCVLKFGMYEEPVATLSAPPDKTGSNNDIQAKGSTLSYLEKYTFLAAVGVAAGMPDDDGNGGEAPKIAPAIPVQKKTDWSYDDVSGVLVCRPVSVERRMTTNAKDPREYAMVRLNGKIGENDRAYCFSASGISALLGSTGKIVRMVARPSKKGNYLNVEKLLDIDGKPFVDNELKVRELSLNLGLTEAELNQLVNDFCKGDWADAKARLEAEQERRKEAGNGAA